MQNTLAIYARQLDFNDFPDRAKEKLNNYICILCGGILCDALIDDCFHMFCQKCYNEFRTYNLYTRIKKKISDELNTDEKIVCPLTFDIVKKISPFDFYNNLLYKQEVYCKNKLCGWIGSYQDRFSHKCLLIVCPNLGCGKLISQTEADSHDKTCEYAYSECLYAPYGCNSKFPRNKLNLHLQDYNNSHNEKLLNHMVKFKEWTYEKIKLIDSSFFKFEEKLKHFENLLENQNSSGRNLGSKKITRRGDTISNKEDKVFLSKKIARHRQSNTNDTMSDTEDKSSEKDDKNETSPVDVSYINQGKSGYHRFIFPNSNSINSPSNKWKIEIKRIDSWMAFGVGNKNIISDNQFRLNSFYKNFDHGCYLITSNGTVLNSDNPIDTPRMKNFPDIVKGTIINIEFSPSINSLYFHIDNFSCCIFVNNMVNQKRNRDGHDQYNDKKNVKIDHETTDDDINVEPVVIMMNNLDEIKFSYIAN